MLGLESCAHDMKKKKKKYPTHICLCMYSSTSLRIMTIKMCLTHPRHCLVTLNQTSVFHSRLLPSNKHFPLSNHKAVLQWNMGTENKNRWWRETSEAPEMKKKMLQIRTDRSLQGLPRTKSVHEWKVLWMQRGEKLWIGMGVVFQLHCSPQKWRKRPLYYLSCLRMCILLTATIHYCWHTTRLGLPVFL